MKNITINQSIGILSMTGQYMLVIIAAILLGKGIWWLANPLGYDTYDNILNRNFDSSKLAQTIINRAPFGLVTEEKAPVPTIADQIKVVGVYAGGPQNSVAFLTINGKNSIAVIGDTVLDGKIKAINPTGVVFFSQNQDVAINLSAASGSNSSTTANASPSHSTGSSSTNNNSNSYIPSSGSNAANNQSQSDNNHQNQTQNSAADSNTGNDNDSIAEKRRKMIEAFQKQNSAGSDNANNGQSN